MGSGKDCGGPEVKGRKKILDKTGRDGRFKDTILTGDEFICIIRLSYGSGLYHCIILKDNGRRGNSGRFAGHAYVGSWKGKPVA